MLLEYTIVARISNSPWTGIQPSFITAMLWSGDSPLLLFFFSTENIGNGPPGNCPKSHSMKLHLAPQSAAGSSNKLALRNPLVRIQAAHRFRNGKQTFERVDGWSLGKVLLPCRSFV
jgi:hypothetical protein